MGSLIGIDFGTKRTGLACTDPLKIIASGLKNLSTPEVIPFLKKYCEMEEVDTFVVGKPLQKDGTPAEVEVDIKNFIKNIRNMKTKKWFVFNVQQIKNIKLIFDFI